jgi:O-antigen/teichoic acid export membrane protein
MKISIGFLLKGTAWTVGAFGVGQVLRVVTNIILARLLAPDLFGIMLIVYSLRTGIDLLSDVGMGQNVIYNKNAEDPDFYNTVWSLQLIRNVLLWLVCLLAAVPAAWFYETPILVLLVPITGVSFLFSGFSSIARFLLQKRLQIVKFNAFDTVVAISGSVALILFAYLSPTIWALVLGTLFGYVASMVGSYFLLPDVRHRFHISRKFTWEILEFGKWIFVSSIVYFLSTNFDRLYLARRIPFDVLGIYGIALSIASLLGVLVGRLGGVVLFPFIASHSDVPRAHLREQLSGARARFLLVAAFGFSVFVAVADLVIKILYDRRYQAAGWMLSILSAGSWVSILVAVNEWTLLGLGRPSYGAAANGVKFAFILLGLPVGVEAYGILGAVMVVAVADLFRYLPFAVGLSRERLSFATQDLLVTLAVLGLVLLWEWLRSFSGFGTSFDSVPHLGSIVE